MSRVQHAPKARPYSHVAQGGSRLPGKGRGMTEIEQETFDQEFCRSGRHARPIMGGECRACRKEASARRNRRRNGRIYAARRDYAQTYSAPDWFPTSAVVPILLAWNQADEAHTFELLAERMGTSTRRLHAWVTGEAKHTRLESVDKFLCAIDQLHHFYTTLSEFYFAGLEEVEAA